MDANQGGLRSRVQVTNTLVGKEIGKVVEKPRWSESSHDNDDNFEVVIIESEIDPG